MKCPYCDGAGVLEQPSFGASVLALRKLRGMTQDELAKAVSLSRPAIANIEADRQETTVTALRALATALSVSPAELLS